MAIIKLTEACYIREKGLKRILGFYNKKSFFETTGAYFREAYAEDINGKCIKCAIFNNRYVKETPGEILELINGEVGLDEKPCEGFMGFSKEYIAKEAKDKGVTFKECLFFLYFFNNVSITPKDRGFKAGVEMYKKFAKATVKALALIKEAENGK